MEKSQRVRKKKRPQYLFHNSSSNIMADPYNGAIYLSLESQMSVILFELRMSEPTSSRLARSLA